jgi:hypothetical protein
MHPLFLLRAMPRALAAACLLLLVACGDKHEPVKPTVGATVRVAASS